MSSKVSQALDIIVNEITSTDNGGNGTNLSALNFKNAANQWYWRGTDIVSYNAFKVQRLWGRFFSEAWEIPPSLLTGSSSAGIIYVVRTGSETDAAKALHGVERYQRDIPIDLFLCTLDEGLLDGSEYEEIIDALISDVLKNPTLIDANGNPVVLWNRLNTVETLRPDQTGTMITRLGFEFSFLR